MMLSSWVGVGSTQQPGLVCEQADAVAALGQPLDEEGGVRSRARGQRAGVAGSVSPVSRLGQGQHR